MLREWASAPVLVLEVKEDFVTLGGSPDTPVAKPRAEHETYLRNQRDKNKWDWRRYPGAHLLTEGPGKTKVIHDIIGWLDSHR